MILAEDLLSYSKELYKTANSEEVALRNVARNSYYALFHELATIELKSIPITERSFGSHEQLIQQLRASDDEIHRKLGILLASLKSIRTKADYKLHQRFTDHDARSTMLKVDRAFKDLSELEPDEEIDIENDLGTSEQSIKSVSNNPPKLSIVK
ncbi:hypothetical protein [Aliivibrio fischeri]|uniref:hypothetical protein n=1 Tax=Aliivibrio fischeri TaxID=668 RepID=UPI0012DACC17|nr:hypothetical protein [Aliivibrio fischeri]MUJ26343.1 hypothetical protein [Aliivibrio fischeri]